MVFWPLLHPNKRTETFLKLFWGKMRCKNNVTRENPTLFGQRAHNSLDISNMVVRLFLACTACLLLISSQVQCKLFTRGYWWRIWDWWCEPWKRVPETRRDYQKGSTAYPSIAQGLISLVNSISAPFHIRIMPVIRVVKALIALLILMKWQGCRHRWELHRRRV